MTIDVKQLLADRFGIKKAYNLIAMPEIQLQAKEAEQFIEYMWDESVMKNYARKVTMDRPQEEIRGIGFGEGRFFVPANEFNESKYKKQWAQNKIRLQTHELLGAFPIYDKDVEDIRQIENEASFKNKLMSMVQKKMANELEEIGYMGDAHGLNGFCADDARSVTDGWRYIINHSGANQTYYNNVTGSAHIKEACLCQSGASCPSGQADPDAHFNFPGLIVETDPQPPYHMEVKYHKMLKNMPAKYKAQNGLSNMVFLNSDLVTQDYLEALSQRGTSLGDAVFTGTVPPAYGKVAIIDVPLMPTNLGQDADLTYGLIGGGEYTDVLLTVKNNLIIGIQRDIRIEPWRYPPDRAWYFFYSIRVAYNIENVDAIVFLRCLTHEC